MRHAHSLLSVVVLVTLVGCATARKRDEAAEAQGKPGAEMAAPEPCAALAMAVPGGIADTEGAVLLLRAEEGIEAVDLATGATLWRNPSVDRAIAVGQGRVAAATQMEDSPAEVRLALLEGGTGALISMGPHLSLGSPDAELRGAFCSTTEVDLAWSDGATSGSARVDLSHRTVIAGPRRGPVLSLRVPSTARIQQLELRAEEGVLRAYSGDGSLRWERPFRRDRVSSRP